MRTSIRRRLAKLLFSAKTTRCPARVPCVRIHAVRVVRIAVAALLFFMLMLVIRREMRLDDFRISGFLRSILFPSVKLQHQSLVDYIAANMRVDYVSKEGGSECCRLRLTNAGKLDIPANESWSIVFNSVHRPSNMNTAGNAYGLRMFHIDGWLYAIETVIDASNLSFSGLAAGKNILLATDVSLNSKSYAFPRWYVSELPSTEVEPRIIAHTDSDTLEFINSSLGSNLEPQNRYDINEDSLPEDSHEGEKSSKLDAAEDYLQQVIPTPLKISWSESGKRKLKTAVRIDTDWSVHCTGLLEKEADFLAERLMLKKDTRASNVDVANQAIRLRLADLTHNFTKVPHVISLQEAYRLEVLAKPDKKLAAITITGQSAAGVFNGIQTLLSLLDSSQDQRSISPITVVDAPRLPYRGLMLDVARNFISKPDLLQIMSTMAMYKMNKLHLHLTDDQGWRLEVPGLPELTQVGGKRGHDMRQMSKLLPFLGSGPFTTNAYGSGYYSVKDYREILRHASKLHIEVIPEVDMPGHAHAAMQSMRVRQAKSGNADYLLTDPDDTSIYQAVNDYNDTVMNPCMESTYRFVKHVVKALRDLHEDIQPLRVIHIGGDEVPPSALVHSPICNRMLSEKREWRGRLRLYFMTRIMQIISELGIEIQVWEDGLLESKNQVKTQSEWNMTLPVYINAWNNDAGHNRGHMAWEYANKGYKVILSHASHLYLDHPHEADFDEIGLFWATRSTSIMKLFGYIPVGREFEDYAEDIKHYVCWLYGTKICLNLTEPDNIAGLEVSLWSEMVRTPDQFNYMLYPRILAAAERAWHTAEWQTAASVDVVDLKRHLVKDWRNFVNVVGKKELHRLERLGVHYRLPPPGVAILSDSFKVNLEIPGLPIQYSLDGEVNWNTLTAPTLLYRDILGKNDTVVFISRSHDMTRSSRRVVVTRKKAGSNV